MSNLQTITIEQIQRILLNPTDKTWVEVSLGGHSYKMQLGILRQFIQNGFEVTQEAAKPYWVSLPEYNVDDQNLSIIINVGGRIYNNGEETDAPARTLPFASVQDPAHSRFDAVVFSLTNLQYELIVGEESENPVTPTYNQQTQLLLTYLFVDPNGGQVQTPPNDHVQNTDQYLDYGGENEISAVQLKELLARLGHYAGDFPTEVDLPATLDKDSFALVSNPLSLWVYAVATGTWSNIFDETRIASKIKAEAESADFTTGDLDATGFWGGTVIAIKAALSRLKDHFSSYYNKTEVDNTLESYATKTFVEDTFSSAYEDKGDLDCSLNPDYPAAEKADSYYISAAGKIGGTEGKQVQTGDVLRCRVTSLAGDELAVGANWYVVQGNLDKATTSDMETGSDDLKYTTAKKVQDKLTSYVKEEAEQADFVTGDADALGFWGGTVIKLRDALLKLKTAKADINHTHTLLDGGGLNEVSAAQLKELHTRLQNYAGYQPTEATLPTPTVDSFALVGDPISIILFDVETGLWSKQKGSSGEKLHYSFYSDLDVIGPEITLEGKIVVDSVVKSLKVTGWSFMVKLDADTAFVEKTTEADLNAWINQYVTSVTTLWQLYPIANFGSNKDTPGSITLNYHYE